MENSITEPKNNLFLKALRQEKVSRPPVWMMRQAGRYLPEYIKLREKYSFFERIETPELAAEITVQPVDIVGVDAAILFSDILVIPQAMGFDVEMVEKKGPVINNPVNSEQIVEKLEIPDVDEKLKYVYDAITVTKQMLNNEVPLIGFAGAPWTILCYIVEGQGSKKGFIKAKEFCFKHEKAALSLLDKITDTTILYLKNKISAGVNAIQLFDSWGGILSPEDYKKYSLPFIQRIVKAIKDETYVISYPKGCWSSLNEFNSISNHGVGVDWLTPPQQARKLLPDVTIQGNLDPMRLLSDIPTIEKMTKEMIDGFGTQSYIANLGHGIIPNIPVDHAKAFVNAVKNYNS